MKKFLSVFIILLLILGCVSVGASADETSFRCGEFTYILENGEATIVDCETEKEHLIVPDTLDGYKVTAISKRAFEGLNSIIKVTIGENVKRIGEYAFFDCCNLKTVKITGDCEEIGDYAFGYSYMRTHEGIMPGMIDWHANTEFYVYSRFPVPVGVAYSTLKDYCKERSFKNLTYVTINNDIGEVDCDEVVTVKDATVVQKYLVGLDYLNKRQRVTGDVNRDKTLDIKDVTGIQKMVAGLDVKMDTRRLYLEVPEEWSGCIVYVGTAVEDYLSGENYRATYDSETGLYYADVPLIIEKAAVYSDYIVELYSNGVTLPENGNPCLIRYVSNTEYNGLFMTYTFECVEITE